MSLLGKPLNYRASRRDVRYRRLQSRIYNFLERPRGFAAILYHIIVFCMVFMCLALSVFSTIDKYEKLAGIVLFYMETVVVIWFAIEFLLRLWSSGCRSRYQGTMGRLKFLRRPFCIVDVITIIASLIVLVVLGLGSNGQVFAASALRGLRFFQILRMVRMDRRGGTWKLLGSVVYAHRQELITTLYIGFLGLIFSSFLVYLAEKDQNKKHFSNFADALWWGVITLCTVGYGDAVPVTWEGKLIASFCALLGISFFALPAGILGSGFALKVQQQQRQKHMIRRRQPAATLIQSLWRCYAADEHSVSVATWKIHQIPLSPPSFKHNASFVSRLPTIRRHKSTSFHHSPSSTTKGTSGGGSGGGSGPGPGGGVSAGGGGSGGTRFAEMNASSENLDEDEEPRCIQLTNQHKVAIRAIRKLQYFVARKKFREALKPYDVKDVIEQYSSGHADLLNRTKNLQYRLDQILGKQGSKAKDVYASKISLASRIVKVERQVDDIEMKLDQLIEIYMEDRKRFAALPAAPSLPTQPQASSWSSSSSTTGIIASTTTGATPIATTTTTTASLSGEGVDCPGVGGCLRPKPILVDKQSSEPNTPTVRCFEGTTTSSATTPDSTRPHRPVCRGHSDLGQRMKKRVTLNSMPSQSLGSPPLGGRDVVIVVPGEGESSGSTATEPNWPVEYVDHRHHFSENCDEEDEDMEEEDEEELEEVFSDGEIQDNAIDVEVNDYEEEDEEDEDDDGEATALLHAAAAATKIVVTTPISPGASCLDLPVATSICETQPHQQQTSQQSPQMDLLRPDHPASVTLSHDQ